MTIRKLFAATISLFLFLGASQSTERPNIILCMADDLGWGDTGYNGHPVLKTPNLDRMAEQGIVFNRFYSASAVCSPTRGSCMTGRHPARYGIGGANDGHMLEEEITLAEVLKEKGYTTGHFGKWHLGTLTTKEKDSNRGKPGDSTHYAPPWEHGFDVSFSTEAKTPTWDPMKDPENPDKHYRTYYWIGEETKASENLEGDDSRVIMDRAIPFIEGAVEEEKPFFAVIWFHTPHNPVIAGKDYREMYSDLDEDHQHYYGCVTALDEQMGRLRETLSDLKVEKNTMLWFCSDNGPAAKLGGPGKEPGARQRGTTGPYRGRKGSLYEGGVRVPGLLVWPDAFPEPKTIDTACVTSDYFPTILQTLEIPLPDRPYDGISLLPVIRGTIKGRPKPIGFDFRDQLAWSDSRYKVYKPRDSDRFELYDLAEDPGESHDLAKEHSKILETMRDQLDQWREDCATSRKLKEY